ncbi:hypothetical protein ACFFMN_32750 [Planobispora siamensis]|uniref:hypothetical protein n=1 Tax=Planobispora siamensis TaxID=936338 RepID=UPI0019525740|nr:hypothetical protein [Planobispora siamensis]
MTGQHSRRSISASVQIVLTCFLALLRRPLPMPGLIPESFLSRALMLCGILAMRPSGPPVTRTSLNVRLRRLLGGLLGLLGRLLRLPPSGTGRHLAREPLPRLHQLFDPLSHLRGPLIGPLRTLPSTLDPFPRLLIAIRHMLDHPNAIPAHHVCSLKESKSTRKTSPRIHRDEP